MYVTARRINIEESGSDLPQSLAELKMMTAQTHERLVANTAGLQIEINRSVAC